MATLHPGSASLATLAARAAECRLCPRMAHRRRVLGPANGPAPARLLFVAEAPGRLGGERTGVPLCGDKSGDNFERLLGAVGWSRRDCFVTNAVLCNPRGDDGRNDRPAGDEIERCSRWLAETLALVDPRVVVTLGAVALRALAALSPHRFELARTAGRRLEWNGRVLVPLYHPSPRVVAVRGFPRLLADFRRLRRIVETTL